MNITENLQNSKKTYFSFEVLPPLKGRNIQEIYDVIDPLMEFEPMNINVTYHQQEVVYKQLQNDLLEKKIVKKRPGTVAISAAINYKYRNTIVVPHIICGGFTKEETEDALIDLHFLGITNILALRGDPPANHKYFTPEKKGHSHTVDLVKQIINMNKGKYCDDELLNSTQTNFTVGVAGYPEKHIESPNMKSDLKYLKKKIEAGASYIVTQMFFDNKNYFDFVDLCRKEGINVPIVPGIKPIRLLKDLQLLPQVFNIDIPEDLACEVEKAKDNNQASQIGIEWAIKQSKELMKAGAPALHYYTIGKSQNIREIAKAIF